MAAPTRSRDLGAIASNLQHPTLTGQARRSGDLAMLVTRPPAASCPGSDPVGDTGKRRPSKGARKADRSWIGPRGAYPTLVA